MSEPTVLKVLGLTPVNPYKEDKIPQSPNSPIMGIELELENIRDWSRWEFGIFTRKEDGSLRNNGSEFVSYPTSAETLKHWVEQFYKRNKVSADNISERCSVHIHLNCQDLTFEQVTSLCMVYQVFERLLFAFVGGDRDKSIFCVPWHQTNITSREVFKKPVRATNFKQWYKYTALNLLPIFQYGTVEFRHMAGQPTVDPILSWIDIIRNMRNFIVENPPEIVENMLIGLNTTSQYDMMVDRIFQNTAPLLKTGAYTSALEEGVLAMKYMLFDNFVKQEKPPLSKVMVDIAERERELAELATRAGAPAGGFFNHQIFREPPRQPAPRQRAAVRPRAGTAGTTTFTTAPATTNTIMDDVENR